MGRMADAYKAQDVLARELSAAGPVACDLDDAGALPTLSVFGDADTTALAARPVARGAKSAAAASDGDDSANEPAAGDAVPQAKRARKD